MRRLLVPLAATLTLAACKGDPLPLPDCPVESQVGEGGRCQRLCSVDTDCLGAERCTGGVCLAVDGARVAILGFDVSPITVTRGEDVIVRYRAQNAASLVLQRRLAGTDEWVEAASSDDGRTEGSDEVGPLQQTVELRLLAIGSDTSQTDVTAPVRVDVVSEGEPARILSFAADPLVVNPGEPTVLRWEVENATNIVLMKMGNVLASGLASSGQRQDTVRNQTTYRLIADGPGGRDQQAVTVRTEVAPDLDLNTSLVPGSGRIRAGDNAVIEWTSAGASQVLVYGPSQQVEFGSQNPLYVADGRWLVVPQQGRSSYTVQASNEDGDTRDATEELQVQARPGPPVLSNVTANPPLLPPDGREIPITVSWQVEPRTAEVYVFGPSGQVAAYTGSGSHTERVSGDQTGVFGIEAIVPDGGQDSETVVVFAQIPEEEGNDTRTRANELDFLARMAVLGRAGTNLDIDWYTIFVPSDDGTVIVQLPTAICPQGFRIELYAPMASAPIMGAQASNNGQCPELVASDLPAGDYDIRVSWNAGGVMMDVPYTISAWVRAPECGDGVLQLGEQCDDGNRASADFCTPDCRPTYVIRQRSGEPAAEPQTPRTVVFTGVGAMTSDEDAGIAVETLPFVFPFAGREFHGVAIFTDGFISFMPSDGTAPSDGFIGPEFPNAIIAPFFADLSVSGGAVEVWTDTTEAGIKRFVISMRDLKWSVDPGAKVSARIELYEDGRAAVAYGRLQVPGNEALYAFAEGPLGQSFLVMPGCDMNGCDAGRLADQRFEITRNDATTGN